MDSTKLLKLYYFVWVLLGKHSLAATASKNLDLDSIITNLFANHGSSYPGNTQSSRSGVQSNPQYLEPSNAVNNLNPGNKFLLFQGTPSIPQFQRPGNIFSDPDPGFNPQGRPSQGFYPQYQRPDINMFLGINPGYNGNGNYKIRPNQINNPQGNVWNNANENPGINYPGGSQFFPGNSAQNPQYQRPGGFSGNPSNGLPVNRPNPFNGYDWFNRNPLQFIHNGFLQAQSQPGMDWTNPNGYPNNQNPNQISVPGNQIQTQGVGRQGFDQQNLGLIQGQPIQYPPGDFHNYRPGLQNGGLFNPSQGSNGLDNQLPGLQNMPNFKPSVPSLLTGQQHKNRLKSTNTTENVSTLGGPSGFTSQSSPHDSPSLMKQCVQDCPTSTEYSPRCGPDNVTYFNEEKVKCARTCGYDVKNIRNGACPS